MLLQSVTSKCYISFLVYTIRKRKKKSEFVSLRACSFYYECIANLRNHILNVDQLEMKHVLISDRSILYLMELIRNHRGCCVFYFQFHDMLSKES